MRILNVGLKSLLVTVLLFSVFGQTVLADEALSASNHQGIELENKKLTLPDRLPRFVYDSGLNFEYPDAVRGIYVTGNSAGGSRFSKLTKFIDSTDLNAMVIDLKDDFGNLTYVPKEDSPLAEYDIGKPYMKDPRKVLEELEKHQIYPIARVVVFKDTVLAEARPELSYKESESLWKNGRGEAFSNTMVACAKAITYCWEAQAPSPAPEPPAPRAPVIRMAPTVQLPPTETLPRPPKADE